MKKKDLLTNQEFVPQRITQKFACAANRIKYYNQLAQDFRTQTDYIKKPLLNNIRILNEVLKDKLKLVVHKEFLLGKGFNFTAYFQSIILEDKTQVYLLHVYTMKIINKDLIEIKKLNND